MEKQAINQSFGINSAQYCNLCNLAFVETMVNGIHMCLGCAVDHEFILKGTDSMAMLRFLSDARD